MMIKQTYRGYTFLVRVNNLQEFQKRFGISNATMKKFSANGFVENPDYDTNVVRNILKSVAPKHYLVRYIDTGDQYGDYWLIYSKYKRSRV